MLLRPLVDVMNSIGILQVENEIPLSIVLLEPSIFLLIISLLLDLLSLYEDIVVINILVILNFYKLNLHNEEESLNNNFKLNKESLSDFNFLEIIFNYLRNMIIILLILHHMKGLKLIHNQYETFSEQCFQFLYGLSLLDESLQANNQDHHEKAKNLSSHNINHPKISIHHQHFIFDTTTNTNLNYLHPSSTIGQHNDG